MGYGCPSLDEQLSELNKLDQFIVPLLNRCRARYGSKISIILKIVKFMARLMAIHVNVFTLSQHIDNYFDNILITINYPIDETFSLM